MFLKFVTLSLPSPIFLGPSMSFFTLNITHFFQLIFIISNFKVLQQASFPPLDVVQLINVFLKLWCPEVSTLCDMTTFLMLLYIVAILLQCKVILASLSVVSY